LNRPYRGHCYAIDRSRVMNYMLVKIPNSKNRDKFRSQLISALTKTLYSLPDFREFLKPIS